MAMLSRQNVCARAAVARCTPVAPRVTLSRRVILSSSNNATAVVTETAVVNLDATNYETFIASHELVVVDYFTDWCGPCKMIAPHLETMAQELSGKVKFAKLNCTSDPAAKKIAMAQGIKALPTFHMFKGGQKAGAFVGGKPAALRKFVDEYL